MKVLLSLVAAALIPFAWIFVAFWYVLKIVFSIVFEFPSIIGYG